MTRAWLVALLFASLAGVAPATAEGPGAPLPAMPRAAKRLGKVPYRVVKLLPATLQAVVFDRDRREHSVVQVGDALGGFQVVDVDEDQLVLSRDGREVVLLVDPSAPMPLALLIPAPHAPHAPTTPAPTVPPGATDPALLDPYGSPVAATTAPAAAPLDPYAASGAPATTAPVTPLDPYALPAAPTLPAPVAVEAPGTLHEVLAPPDQRASLQTAAVLDPYAEPIVVAAPAGAEPMKGVPAPTSDAAKALALRAEVMPLQRAQLEAAVASFDKLAKDHGFERTGRGVRLRQVAADSYAYGLGLRGGDVITAIDGAPLRGLDDAAGAYVRMSTATRLSLDVERGATRGTLRFTLK